jgi:hypothetical protein
MRLAISRSLEAAFISAIPGDESKVPMYNLHYRRLNFIALGGGAMEPPDRIDRSV